MSQQNDEDGEYDPNKYKFKLNLRDIGKIFDDISLNFDIMGEYTVYFTILILTLLIIGHALLILFFLKVNKSIKAEKQDPQLLQSQQQRQEEINIEQYNEDYFQNIFIQVYNAMISLFYVQTMYMMGSAMLLIFSTAYWFTPTLQSAIVCIFAFMLGSVVGSVNAYICLRFTVCTNMKIVTESYINQKGVLRFAFLIGSALSSLGVSLLIMILSTFFFVAHKTWNLQDGENHMNQIQYLHLTHSVLGYGVGICYASLFYRETAGQASRGILAGEELIGRIDNGTQESIIIEKNVKMGSIIASIYINNLVQYMDSLAILASLLSSLLIISAEVSIFTSEEQEEIKYKQCFYAPMYFLSWFIVISVGIAWIVNGTYDDNDLVNNVAFQTRLQFYIVLPSIWIISFILPWIIFPQSFDVGDTNHPSFHAVNIFRSNIIWCITLGLILLAVLIAFSEYSTSHYFQPTRDVSTDTSVRSSLGLMSIHIFASQAQLFIIFLVASFIALSYILAGFMGVGMLALGLLSSTVTLLSINYLGGFGDDGLKCAKIAQTYVQVIDRITKLAWVVRNYQIYTQIINGTGIFITNIVCIGAILILTKINQVFIWSGFTLFGFIYGSSLAYVLRGGGTAAARDVAVELVKDYNDSRSEEEFLKQERLINRPEPEQFQKLIDNKYNTGIFRVSINIIISVLSIILIGGLFGGESIIGFVIGLNVVGLHITLMQLLIGNSLKSSKFYKSIQLDEDEGLDQKTIQNNKDNLLYALTVQSLPGSTLISYLAFNTLFVLLGSSAFAHAGSFREFIERSVSYVPEHSTKWLDKTEYYTESGLSSLGNTMGANMTQGEDYNDYPVYNTTLNSTNNTSQSM